MAMQTAQLVKQLGLHPRRTIRVIAWMNEELDNFGGRPTLPITKRKRKTFCRD